MPDALLNNLYELSYLNVTIFLWDRSTVSLIWQMREWRGRMERQAEWSRATSKWWSWDLNPGSLTYPDTNVLVWLTVLSSDFVLLIISLHIILEDGVLFAYSTLNSALIKSILNSNWQVNWGVWNNITKKGKWAAVKNHKCYALKKS